MSSFIDILHNAKLKATPARVAILEILKKSKTPRTIEEIQKSLEKRSINLVTVYRSLHSLHKSSIVRRIDFQHGHAHYELAGTSDHHHLVCIKCDRVEDFGDCGAEEMVRRAIKSSRHFSRVRDHSFELFGLCKSCVK